MMDRHNTNQGALKVYAAILEYKLKNQGVSPSIPELVEMTGYHSTKPINDRLHELETLGLISRKAGTPRSITVTGGRWESPAKMPKDIQGRQADVYRAICRHAKKNDGNPPTLANLGQALGFRSDSTAGYHIRRLQDAGILKTTDGSHRSVVVNGSTYQVDVDAVPQTGRATASSVLTSSMVGA